MSVFHNAVPVFKIRIEYGQDVDSFNKKSRCDKATLQHEYG